MASDFRLTFKDTALDTLSISPAPYKELRLVSDYEGMDQTVALYFDIETVRDIRDVLDFWLKEVDDA